MNSEQIIQLLHEMYSSYLYHATRYSSLINILQQHTIFASSAEGTNNISFSRSLTYWHVGEYRLILDRDRVSRDYKISPISAPSYSKRPGRHFEYEEEIRGRPLKNLERYLVAIEYKDDETFFDRNMKQNYTIQYYLKEYPRVKFIHVSSDNLSGSQFLRSTLQNYTSQNTYEPLEYTSSGERHQNREEQLRKGPPKRLSGILRMLRYILSSHYKYK